MATNDKQNTSGRQGFAKDHDLASEAGRKGGQASHAGGGHAGTGQQGMQHRQSEVGSGKHNDPNNFANDRQKASDAGRKGGQHS